MDVFLFLTVRPGTSADVARKLFDRYKVTMSAAVWGPWDVVARATFESHERFDETLDAIHNENTVTRTETCIIRRDQLTRNRHVPQGRNIAFVLLQTPPSQVGSLVTDAADLPLVAEAVGTYGATDVVLSVFYSSDAELRTVVMDRLQSLATVRESRTVIGIEGMHHQRGELERGGTAPRVFVIHGRDTDNTT